MSEKTAYQAQLEAQLQEWQANLDLLQERAKQAGSQARLEYERQLAELERHQEALAKKLDDMRRANEGAWKDMQAGMEKAWTDMADAMRDAMSRYR